MKVTQKGQVTIPLEIRKKLGIDQFSEVNFVEKDGHVILEKAKSVDKSQSRIRALRGISNSKLTTEEILALTR